MTDNSNPSVIGLKRSFGFGDRLGLAAPGHIEAARESGFAPFFAQQSIRELTRTGRAPLDVINSAASAVKQCGWDQPWGADADHLQTRDDVLRTASAGFTMFTIDPSAHVNKRADNMPEAELDDALKDMCENKGLDKNLAFEAYHDTIIEMDNHETIRFDTRNKFKRAVVKYGAALLHTAQMAGWVRDECAGRPYELEMSVDETPYPTSPLEHIYIAMELKRMGVSLVSLAPKFIGDFEKGVDYKGDLVAFERQYMLHIEIAKRYGPYKLSIHSGSDKFAAYPVIGRLSGELLHVKTAGTSYLEALRAVCRTDKHLFKEIAEFCRGRYDQDKASYHVSASLANLPEKIADSDLEKIYLETNAGRQVLHVTFGSVLSGGKNASGALFKTLIIENLSKNQALYSELLHKHLGKHLRILRGG